MRHYWGLVTVIFLLFLFTACGSKKSKTYSTPNPKNTAVKTTPKHTNNKADAVVKEAKEYIGTRYKFGGTDKKGIDCSGLTCAAYESVGVTLPRTSNEQSNVGTRVYIGELQVGDLVFFGDTPNSKKITHVGIVSSVSSASIKFIHASTRAGVVESELHSDWYKPRYIKAVRPLK